MKKIIFSVLLSLTCLLMLAGCGAGDTEESEYSVFYITKDGTGIVEEPYGMAAEDTDGMIKELLIALSTDSGSVDYRKPIPNEVEVTNYYLESNQLSVYFDEDYRTMDSMTEVLCRAAVVETLIRIPEVQCVSFYVGGVPLSDASGNLVGVMTTDSFVENPGEQINSIQTANITLYFSNKTGDALVTETQEVHYSSNISMEKLVVERLLAGPLSENAVLTIPSGTQLLSVSSVDGVCYVNFDETFTNQNYEIQEPVVIYSIVDSLLELPTITKVQISVNGDTSGVYRDKFSLSTLYERNLDYLEKNRGTVPDTEKEVTESGE